MKVRIEYGCESVNVTDMDQQPNAVTCCTSHRDNLLNVVLSVYVVISL